MDSDLDDIILEWIYGRRANGPRVSRKLITVKAKHSYDESCPEGEQDTFKGTEGWLQKFILLHGLSLRTKTTTAQQDPHRLIDKCYLISFRFEDFLDDTSISLLVSLLWMKSLCGMIWSQTLLLTGWELHPST